ncbi:hypothetical protein RIF29_34104 [Crotalaria pallida]|uniref:Uncharacterized protein n=1 Tax=Crotalaria pallida TaxID=3830 RepID=A0AAN9E930_CROPI
MISELTKVTSDATVVEAFTLPFCQRHESISPPRDVTDVGLKLEACLPKTHEDSNGVRFEVQVGEGVLDANVSTKEDHVDEDNGLLIGPKQSLTP